MVVGNLCQTKKNWYKWETAGREVCKKKFNLIQTGLRTECFRGEYFRSKTGQKFTSLSLKETISTKNLRHIL